MKKLLTIISLLIFSAAIFLSACKKENSPAKANSSAVNTSAVNANIKNTGRWYLYWADWAGWGRAKRGCDGWGLCGYTDCWNCDVPQSASKHSGLVSVDPETGEGYLTIELDPSEPIQNDAIQQHLPFNVDEDINNPNSILHQGEYQFNPEIGTYGGYKLSITVKQ